MKFEDNLRELRKQYGLSQEELAQRLSLTRQSISKWENGSASPELDKLMQLCELFHCTLDDLLKGEVGERSGLNRSLYEKEMNIQTLLVCAGTAMIMDGVSVHSFLSEQPSIHEELANIVFLLFVLAGVVCFVLMGIKASFFEKRYPSIPLGMYQEEEIRRFEQRYGIAVASGVGLLIFSFILQQLCESRGREDIGNSLFLLTVGIALCIFVYFGMQKNKYDKTQVHEYSEKDAADERFALYAGIIMVICTAIYLVWSFGFYAWEISWLIFAIGGLCCAVLYLYFMIKRKQ